MSEWKPIETAPRDGTSILICTREGHVMEADWWDDWYGDKSKPGWMPANLDEEYGRYIEALYWMPLPEPPTPSQPSQERT